MFIQLTFAVVISLSLGLGFGLIIGDELGRRRTEDKQSRRRHRHRPDVFRN